MLHITIKTFFAFAITIGLSSTIGLAQAQLNFTIEQPPPLQIDTEQDITLILGEDIEIGSPAVATGGWGGYSYQWSPAQGLNDSRLPNPVASPTQTTTYTLTVTDSCNCQASTDVTITIDKITGVQPDKAKDQVKVYPNPGTQYIALDLSALADRTSVKVKIYNSQGKIVKEAIVSEKKNDAARCHWSGQWHLHASYTNLKGRIFLQNHHSIRYYAFL